MAARMAGRCFTIVRCRRTKAGMRQRRALPIQFSSALGASVLGLLFMGAPRISSPAWMIRRTKLLCHIVVCCYRGTGIGSGARHDGLLG